MSQSLLIRLKNLCLLKNSKGLSRRCHKSKYDLVKQNVVFFSETTQVKVKGPFYLKKMPFLLYFVWWLFLLVDYPEKMLS